MEQTITLTQEELDGLIVQAIKKYKQEEAKEKKKDKYHNTFAAMKMYRDVAIHIEKSISEADQLRIKGMTEHEKKAFVQSIRESKLKSMIMTSHIDTMVEEIKQRRQQDGREVEFTAFEKYFFEGLGYEQIAEQLDCGTSTARRWVSAVLRDLSPLLWGYDALKE